MSKINRAGLSMLFFAAAGLLLAACVSGKPEGEASYKGKAGTAAVVETDRESCIRACNMEYERCGDMLSSTRSEVGNQPTPKPFGIASECINSLKTCLDRCKGR